MNSTANESPQLAALQQALRGLREQRGRLERLTRGPVAVLGMGCRFPGGADTPDEFWQLLRRGVHAVGETPAGRWDVEAFYDPDPAAPGKMYTRCGGFLERIEEFDPEFFGIAPREAATMDPQQRLVLEVGWEALEHAGFNPRALAGSQTGVYVGVSGMDYALLQAANLSASAVDAYAGTGNAHSVIPGRLSYFLGLRGPSLAVDTACSSSLVTTHLACQALRAGECDLALAGGVNLILSPMGMVTFCKARMLAADGRCKTFDEAADGYVRGEGCGMVVLKRLADALADQDPILAVIRGSAVNQDGASAGLTVPSGPAQERVIRQALQMAGVEPAQIDYVECHGTGTALGDPIEVRALGAVLKEGRDVSQPFAVGSVKTNIGHLEAAAGIAGLIKMVLALQHREIPPLLHLRQLNPHIAREALPLIVPTAPTPWAAGEKKRLGGVSAFAFNGTNAHLILEEAPERTPLAAACERPVQLLAASARGTPALRELAGRYARFLQERPTLGLADFCHTANLGRAPFAQRLAVAAGSVEELQERLEEFAGNGLGPGVQVGQAPEQAEPPPVAFLFTGQGAHYAGMGSELGATQPVFRQAMERCDQLLQPLIGHALWSLLEQPQLLEQTQYAQPALFALEFSLARLWQSWGIVPQVVMGHSVGEYVAACVAGVFSLEDGLRLIAERARLMQALPAGGAMAAVLAAAERVGEALAGCPGVEIAAFNGPLNTVISGDREAVDTTCRKLLDAGIEVRPLRVSHAFHSARMAPMLDDFERFAEQFAYAPPAIEVMANVTGRPAGPQELQSAGYWRNQVRQPVCFAAGMAQLYRLYHPAFVELGPGVTLLGMGKQCLPEQAGPWLPSLRRGQAEWPQILESLGRLFVRGAVVDWRGFDQGYARRKIAIPGYPFQRTRCWIEERRAVSMSRSALGGEVAGHPLLGRRQRSVRRELQFEAEVGPGQPVWLADHQVFGEVVLPAAGYFEAGLAAAAQAFGEGGWALEDFEIRAPLVLNAGRLRVVQSILSLEDETAAGLQFFSCAPALQGPETWTLHAAALVRKGGAEDAGEQVAEAPSRVRQRCPEKVDPVVLYQRFAELGIEYGPAFQGVVELWLGAGEALGRIQLPEAAGPPDGCQLHPVVLDAALQLLGAAWAGGGDASVAKRCYLPVGVERLRLYRPGAVALWGHARVRDESGETIRGDVRLMDEEGRLAAELEGVLGRRVRQERVVQDTREWLYEIVWQERPLHMPRLPADYLPAPGQLAADLRALAARLQEECRLDQYRQLLPLLDSLVAQYILRAFARLGWRWRLGETIVPAGIMGALEVAPQHRRLMGRFLEILAEEGILDQAGEGWIVRSVPALLEPQPLLVELLAGFPDCQAELNMAGPCGERLAEVLRGECDPLQLLFPDGSVEEAQKLYRDAPFARALNRLAAQAIAASLARLPERRAVRLLEIGAGTGGTTAFVLPQLPAARVDYVFTDISPLFTTQARQAWSAYPFVRCEVLDIERDPLEQGFGLQQFDLVLAVNVLHATRQLRQTLEQVRTLMVPEGLLVLVEGTRPQRLLDLLFGPTEGWWRFTDVALRPSYPLLGERQWLTLLQELGFSEPLAVPGEERGEAWPQALILGRAPSVARSPEMAGRDRSCWLLFADRGGLGGKLAERLAANGDPCMLVYPGEEYAAPTPTQPGTLDPRSVDQVKRLLDEVLVKGQRSCRGVVHLWSLDHPGTEAMEADELAWIEARVCGSALSLIQGLVELAGARPRFCLVTQDAWAISGSADGLAVASTPLWGLGKTLDLEHPEFRAVRIDLDAADCLEEQAAALYDEVRAESGETEVAFRGGKRLVARVMRGPGHAASVRLAPPADLPWRLEISAPGRLESLKLVPLERRPPGPGEVEIEVEAAGLNFLDVLGALGTLPFAVPRPGGECAGRIAAVGEGVREFQVGDAVTAIAPGSFAGFATTAAWLAAKRPETLDSEAAATIPIAFLTACDSLYRLANLQAGERVLIHAAAGGVGLAAVQLAQRVGAEVFATAGSPHKRAYLRSLGIGWVKDSRTLDFAAELMADTGGEGVAVVLNALSGEFIPQSLAVLQPGGRFVEIGKREIWSAAQVARFKEGVHYFVYDLIEECRDHPQRVGETLRELVAWFQAGSLRPLPATGFPIEESIAAFRFMAQARHTGKIVLRLKGQSARPAALQMRFRPDRAYLITGGLGGLGLRCARWMVEQGARQLALLGRGEPSEAARRSLAELERQGAAIRVERVDVADRPGMKAVFDELQRTMPRLAGVIHAAGTLDDGVLQQQTWNRFAAVLAPKVQGAWNLHQLTRDQELDFFVLFSSTASFLGSPGQGNHAAANAFLDGLAHYRRRQGLPALSVNWAAWAEVGAAAARRVTFRGLETIAPDQGLAVLDRLLLEQPAQAAVAPILWPGFLAQFPAGQIPPLLRVMAEETQHREAPAAAFVAGEELRGRLQAAPAGERRELLVDFVRAQIVQVMGLDAAQPLDTARPLDKLGLDSLMAVELRNAFSALVGQTLPASLLFDYPTIERLAEYLGREVLEVEWEKPAVVEPTAEMHRRQRTTEEIQRLSEPEAETLLLDKLAAFEQEEEQRQ